MDQTAEKTTPEPSQPSRLLDGVNSPADVKKMPAEDLPRLADEIRDEIVDITSRNGGHVASNLGVVELAIALHSVFDTPVDKVVWDTGHQCYAHKLLTGRRELMRTLRQDNGCVGFTSPTESAYDAFGAGHAGTAISAALGLAAARDLRKSKEKVIAVIGDATLSCGVSLEALNNVAAATKDIIIILNDNKMSISRNVGAIAEYLNTIIPTHGYNRFKAKIRNLIMKIPAGDRIRRAIRKIEEATKSILMPGVLFEKFGVRYFGPINGHDIKHLVRTLSLIKDFNEPVVLHVFTEKGKGYEHARNHPERFHGLSCFDPDTGEELNKPNGATFSSVLGKTLISFAEERPDIVAITAAMRAGTGLSEFAKRFPSRFHDVGIAEEHAIVFAAGLAAGGVRPVAALYATFLQRALGCALHDICLQNLPVIICADRAGVVDDGPTHHGIHDLAYLKELPNTTIMAPATAEELADMLRLAYKVGGLAVIRYPRATVPDTTGRAPSAVTLGASEVLKDGHDLSIWALGPECQTARRVAEILEAAGRSVNVVNARFIRPFDTSRLVSLAEHMPIVTIEDNQIHGGLGACVDETLINVRHKGVHHFGWGRKIVPHGTIAGIKRSAGLDPETIAARIKEIR